MAANPSTLDMTQTLHVSSHVAVAPGSTVQPVGEVSFSFTGMDNSGFSQKASLVNGDASLDLPATKFSAGKWMVKGCYSSSNRPNVIGGSCSDDVQVELDLAATTTALTVDKPSAGPGEPVTFTATVGGSGASATGTATFSVDGDNGTAVPIDGGSASWTTSDLSPGAHQVIAYYGSSGTYLAGGSTPVTVTITGLASTITVTPDHPQAAPSQNVTFAVAVAGAGDPPSGRVTILVDGKAAATPLLDDQGKATWSTHTLSEGTHRVVATYAGDGRYGASRSTPATARIAGAPTASPGSGSSGTPPHAPRAVPAPHRPALAGLPMLPATGPLLATLIIVASGLLVAGTALVLAGRRRRGTA